MAMPPAGHRDRLGRRAASDEDVRDEARRRKIDLVLLPTAVAIGALTRAEADTNAVLHLTC